VIAQVLEQMRRQLQEQLPDDTATMDQIEDAAGKIGRQVSQEVQKRLLQKRNPPSPAPKQECTCGTVARYKGQQARTLVTTHGLLTYKRACYYCKQCQHTLAPLDEQLALDGGSTTTQVRLFIALLAGQLPFAQAATTLQILTGVSLSAASVERISVAMGSALRQSQDRKAQQHQNNALPEPSNKRPKRLYIGMDGVFVPLRERWKRDRSQGELACRYGECKSGVVYEAYPDKKGKDSRVRTHAYIATLGNVATFAPLLGTLAHEQGHHLAKEVVVIGDGAPWIWQLAAKQFAGAVQIVDFFHAAQHLATLAEERFGKDSQEGRDRVAARCRELKQNDLAGVLSQIEAWHPTAAAKQDIRRTTYWYFYNNAQRMQYGTFLEKGYHIGSGVVEATCKHVVAQRLDQAGMHWRQETAEAIVALRAAQRSTYPPDLRPYCAMPS
jgi:hypothetical protein